MHTARSQEVCLCHSCSRATYTTNVAMFILYAWPAVQPLATTLSTWAAPATPLSVPAKTAATPSASPPPAPWTFASKWLARTRLCFTVASFFVITHARFVLVSWLTHVTTSMYAKLPTNKMLLACTCTHSPQTNGSAAWFHPLRVLSICMHTQDMPG